MADEIEKIALDWHDEGRKIALATVVETWGSAPRPVGSQLVIDDQGQIEGSVSGGCVEGAVITEALELIERGESRVLTFGVSDDDAFAVGLACGGQIQILIEPVGAAFPVSLLREIYAAQEARRPFGYRVGLSAGSREALSESELAVAQTGLDDASEQFTNLYLPQPRMIVVGGVHIAQHLLPMARRCGFDLHLIEPRPVFGTDLRFPGETIIEDWPDDALAQLAPDSQTAVITLTHDPKLDDPALRVALASPARYIGSLGSCRTHAKRITRLTEEGFTEAQLARIHAPVGLAIGAKSPAEIAVSILAEVIAAFRGAS